MNPLCSLETISGSMIASLSARIFEMILNLKFAIVIGLNWPIEYALGDFGTKTTVLAFQFGLIQLELKNSRIALMTSSLITSQYVWNKKALKSS